MAGTAGRLLMGLIPCLVLDACAGQRTGTEDDRRGPGQIARARVISCALGKQVAQVFRGSPLERHWRRIEKDIEKPLQEVVGAGYLARDAFESLKGAVLERHEWTLTRYMVRVLRELEAPDLATATALLRSESYARHALDDATWDGTNGWDVVRGVRAETVEILKWIDDVASGRAVHETVSGSSGGGSVPSSEAIASQAREVARKLIEAASELEPYYLDANCREPDDPNALTAGRLIRSI